MILITGGAGYLGGRIAYYLVQSGIQVRIGSRSSSYDRFQMDLLDVGSLEHACEGVSTIIHLAAMNAQDCGSNPELALEVNVLGTLNLLKAAERMGVKKVLYFSTAHVYGSPLKGYIDENTLPHPLHSYSITHRVAEDYLLETDSKTDISGTILRLTNAVGSPVSLDVNCWMLVVNDLCRQVVLNRCMDLNSSESVQRDYLPISAVCSAVSAMLENDMFDGEVVNVSSGSSRTLRSLTDLIVSRTENVLGFRPSVHFKHTEKNDNIPLLEISNDKLIKSGMTIDMDITNEIDQLLINCNGWFGK